MADDDAARNRKRLATQREFLKVIHEARSVCAKLADLLAKAEEVAASGQSHAAAVLVEFRRRWEVRMAGEAYSGNAAADAKVMRRLVTTHGADEVRARMDSFFRDTDDWVRRQSWSVAVFEKKFPHYRPGFDGGHEQPDLVQSGYYQD